MIKKILLLCFLVISFLPGCTNTALQSKDTATNDSINKYLDLAANDTIPLLKKINYSHKAFVMLDLTKKDTTSLNLLYKTALNYYRINEIQKLKFIGDVLLKKGLLLKDPYRIALANKILGLYYMNNSENEKALYHFFKAKKTLASLNKYSDVIGLLNNISLTQYYAGDFLGSNKSVFEILKLRKKHQSYVKDEIFYNQIGNNLANLKQDDRAIEYYKKVNREKISLRFKNIIVNNMASSYIELKQYQNALNELHQIINNNVSKELSPNNYATSLSLLGLCKLKMNNLTDLPNIFFDVERMYTNNNSTNGRNYNFVYLSMYYEKVNNTSKAILYATKAVALSKEYKNPSDILYSLKQLIAVDKKNASAFAQDYIVVNDSMQIAERQFRDKFARIAYETDEITQEKNNAIHQKWLIIGLASFLLLVIILLLIITYQRAKQKELRLFQEQQQANEKIYHLMLTQKSKEDEVRQTEKKRIALELHDGIMNKLASTRLNLSVLSHNSNQETIDKCITYIHDIRTIEQDIRSVSHELNHDIFKKADSFIKLLEDFTAEQNHNSKTHFVLETDPEIPWNKISSELKMHLYRIVQEACHNINKYAQAQNAIITFTIDIPNICLSITDDGIGFDTTLPSKGIGIQNMKARVKSLNGKFSITSIVKENTSITIALPF